MLNNWISTYQFNDSIFLWALILVPVAILLYALLKIKNRESLQISSLMLFSPQKVVVSPWGPFNP